MNAERLKKICDDKLSFLGLGEAYKRRLSLERREIVGREEQDYFLDLYDRKVKFAHNEHNLIVPYLLDIVPDFDIDEDPACDYGEQPDIDIDYLPEIRNYLKNDWAPRTFGPDRVSNIGNYNTYKIKFALLDMARVHGEDYGEIQAITKKLESKDDEGDDLTWDKALEIYPDLKDYCDRHPDIAKAAQKMLRRNRGMGQHAGGLIISSSRLDDLVPLVQRNHGLQFSAWSEGQATQDLQPVGLVKFDLLIISQLIQLAEACKLVKERHGIKSICAKEGYGDWSDTSYLNDPKALEAASRGDLRCIFQFDASESIRQMCRKGQVDKFGDLVAFLSLYRPGPLAAKMHEDYIKRKNGFTDYDIHPVLQPILQDTYGVYCYQEQVMSILNKVGEIPMSDCYVALKAISKKKKEKFIRYKDKFISNGKNTLGWSEQKVNQLWNDIEGSSDYCFNKSHAVAYAYNASRMLYLKVHYPFEFYTAVLRNEADFDKLKEVKIEVEDHSVVINRLDVNKSKVCAELVENEIWYGFQNIKGIGTQAAEKIVSLQPFNSFEDFLLRFGTDAKVVTALIGLRCFKDAPATTLMKFALHFKDYLRKCHDRNKRHVKSRENFRSQLVELLKDHVDHELFDVKDEELFKIDRWSWLEEDLDYTKIIQKQRFDKRDGIDKTMNFKWNHWNEVCKVCDKFHKSVFRYEYNVSQKSPKLADFDPSLIEIEKETLKDLRSVERSERRFYGWPWRHKIERSPDFVGGKNFDQFRQNDRLTCCQVEIEILSVKGRVSRNGKTKFWQAEVEDARGEKARINIWELDYLRFQEEIKAGNLVKMRVVPPKGQWVTYTFESCLKHERSRKIPARKEDDVRLIVMNPAPSDEEEVLTDEEVMQQFDGDIDV